MMLRVDFKRHVVQVGKYAVDATPIELKIVYRLKQARGAVVSRPQIFQSVWGAGDLNSRTIDQHISTLREKLREVTNEKIIKTVNGHGYKLNVIA